MYDLPPHLAVHDVPHLGVMLKRARERRGLSQTDVARAVGVTSSAISKFESTGRSRRSQIVERYIQVLQAGVLNGIQIHAPLSQDDATLLRQLSRDSLNRNDGAPTAQLSAYDFTLITSPHVPPALRTLVHQLRQTPWPAFISDGLWFVHAVNGAMLNLFGISPEATLLHRWESWHMMATNFTASSPQRDAHVSPNSYLPLAIHTFFRSTAPYLFTPQMRALLSSLHQLSRANNMHFSTWWHLSSSFSVAFEMNESARILRRGPRYLLVAVRVQKPRFVPVTARMSVPYVLGVWRPLGAESQATLSQLAGPAASQELFFATHYDARQTFHVNSWPEIKDAVPFAG